MDRIDTQHSSRFLQMSNSRVMAFFAQDSATLRSTICALVEESMIVASSGALRKSKARGPAPGGFNKPNRP
jgi:hypothetical protein